MCVRVCAKDGAFCAVEWCVRVCACVCVRVCTMPRKTPHVGSSETRRVSATRMNTDSSGVHPLKNTPWEAERDSGYVH